MPIYVYKCFENEHVFEKKQKFSDAPIAECPECGSAVRKVINSVGIVFKGSGFYVTDNRGSNSAAPSTKKNDGENTGGGDNGEKSAEKIPKANAAKSESTKKSKADSKSAETTG